MSAVVSADRSGWRFVLATDLDGTFLGGTDAQRRELYSWIEARRDEVGLIFVSGRDPRFIRELCSTGTESYHGDQVLAPWPDYVVGDVGTTIAAVDAATETVAPLPALEGHIREAWQDRNEWIRSVLADAPGIREQDGPFRHRASYHWDPDVFDRDRVKPLEDAGLDVLFSHGCYLDILPGGVSKGPSLLRLLTQLNIDPERVLVAGDTMNDLSMFETGLHGAVVGRDEPELLERTKDLPRTRHCELQGTGGIAEAIRFFDLHPDPPALHPAHEKEARR